MGRTKSQRRPSEKAAGMPAFDPTEANVRVPDREAVQKYLAAHSSLAKHLPAICEATRNAFGLDAELSLELYVDPETGDCYLTLYVRVQEYNPQFIDALEMVSGPFEEQLATVAGYFLLTSDFRQPGCAHGV
jgi:hypothetical protein